MATSYSNTVIAGITKEITYARSTRDFDCYISIDGSLPRYIGSRGSHLEAEKLCNDFVYDYLTDTGTFETAAELLMRAA